MVGRIGPSSIAWRAGRRFGAAASAGAASTWAAAIAIALVRACIACVPVGQMLTVYAAILARVNHGVANRQHGSYVRRYEWQRKPPGGGRARPGIDRLHLPASEPHGAAGDPAL